MPSTSIRRNAISWATVICALCSTGAHGQKSPSDTDTREVIASKCIALLQKLPNKDGLHDASADWNQNPEVKQIVSYTADKRIAAIYEIIEGLKENDKKVFVGMDDNPYLLVAMIISRSLAYLHLKQVVGSSEEMLPVTDYLDSEVAELRLVLDRKLPFQIYMQNTDARYEKLGYIVASNEGISIEVLRFKISKDGLINRLANKTTGSTLLDACAQNISVCARM